LNLPHFYCWIVWRLKRMLFQMGLGLVYGLAGPFGSKAVFWHLIESEVGQWCWQGKWLDAHNGEESLETTLPGYSARYWAKSLSFFLIGLILYLYQFKLVHTHYYKAFHIHRMILFFLPVKKGNDHSMLKTIVLQDKFSVRRRKTKNKIK
jgi:hypothetical protein